MSSIVKKEVTPEQLRIWSYKLAYNVLKSGFVPDIVVAIWRGGAPVGVNVHELFKWKGLNTDHICVRTSRYKGIDEIHPQITVDNLEYLFKTLNSDSKILIVDDIYDSGKSVEALIKELGSELSSNIRVGTLFYKPGRNKTSRIPDYYVEECKVANNVWVVFPHEVEGMSLDEIRTTKGEEVFNIFKDLCDVSVP